MSRILIDSAYARFYRELLRIAQIIVRDRPWISATPCSLVHDSFLRLENAEELKVQDELHVRRLAARTMMWVVADRARRKGRAPMQPLPEAEEHASVLVDPRAERAIQEDVAVEDLVKKLRHDHAGLADAFTLGWAGYSTAEVAEVIGKSIAQTERYQKQAKQWLAGCLALDMN